IDENFLLREAQRKNPAALMLLAFRRAMETESDMEMRLEARKQLIALMMEYRYNREYQARILRLLEWVMMLPETLEQQVEEFVEQYKRERKTTFVSRFERRMIEQGLQQGLQQGRQQGLQQGLERGIENSIMRILLRRFGAEAERVRASVEAIESIETLEQLLDAAIDAPTLEVFSEKLEQFRAGNRESRE
ncbi:MAG: hypothetical protein N2651_07395, partial [Fimbriimonadales bacterium]|nr:hypothetical protein [Fimbriimonadales bacterium]